MLQTVPFESRGTTQWCTGYNFCIDALQTAASRPLWKWLLRIWATIGAYDLFGAELASSWLRQRMPTVSDIIAATTGWLPWWAWLWIGTAIIAVSCIEYSVRLSAPYNKHTVRKAAVLQIKVGDIGQRTMGGSENISTLEVLDNGQCIVEFKQPIKYPSRLTARIGEQRVELLTKGKYRASFDPPEGVFHPLASTMILFETNR